MSYVSDLAEGTWVVCDDPDLWGGGSEIARTAAGFCQFCGSTAHRPQNADEFEAPENDPAEADPAEAELREHEIELEIEGVGRPTFPECPLHGAGCEAWA